MRALPWPYATRRQFACCDYMPDANTLTVRLLAVIAQHERETISQCTKDALKAKKAKGAQLGTPAKLTEEARQLGLEARQCNAREHGGIRQATALILARWAQELSCERIAGELNALGFTARRGGAPLRNKSSDYSSVQMYRSLKLSIWARLCCFLIYIKLGTCIL